MKIFRKELAKIFNFRLILILVGFAVIFEYLFINLNYYPGYSASSPYDVPFYEELVTEFGPTLSRDEYDGFLQKKKELAAVVEAEMQNSEVFRKYGVETIEQFEEYHNKSGELTEEEELILEETTNFWFRNETTEPILFRIQVLNRYIEKEGTHFFADDTDMEYWSDYFSRHSPQVAERMQTLFRKNEVSLLPSSLYNLINDDFLRLVILSVICCFVLILSYQIAERLRGILPIAASTKIGRHIFKRQMSTSVISGAILGLIIGGIYGVMLWSKNVFTFAACPLSGILYRFWLDMSFGQYMLLCFLLLILISAAAALLAYFIGRLSANYIAGIAVSIPSAAVYYVLVLLFGNFMLKVGDYGKFSSESLAASLLWTFGGIALLIGTICAVSGVLLKRDRRRDIL